MSLSSSFQTAPTFWLNPINGVVYQVAVTSPQYRVDSLDALLRTPVASSRGGAAQAGGPQLLGNLVQVSPAVQPQVVSHFNITPVVDVYAAVQGRDRSRPRRAAWRAPLVRVLGTGSGIRREATVQVRDGQWAVEG